MSPRRLFAGSRLRAIRTERRLKQSELAAALAISTSYLSQLENDDRPLTPALIERLSRAFPLDWREIPRLGWQPCAMQMPIRCLPSRSMPRSLPALPSSSHCWPSGS